MARITQPQLGAKVRMSGSGRPASQPATSSRLRPTRSASRPANKFSSALVTPKLTRKDRAAEAETSPNSALAISGTMVRSSPTMEPTKALTTTNSVNCCQLALRPSRMDDDSTMLPPFA